MPQDVHTIYYYRRCNEIDQNISEPIYVNENMGKVKKNTLEGRIKKCERICSIKS